MFYLVLLQNFQVLFSLNTINATVIDSFLVIQQIRYVPCSKVISRMINYNAADNFNPYLHPFDFQAGEKKLNNIQLRIKRHIKVTIMRHSTSILGSQDHIQRITMYCNNDRKMWEKPYLYIQALFCTIQCNIIWDPDHICIKVRITIYSNYKQHTLVFSNLIF